MDDCSRPSHLSAPIHRQGWPESPSRRELPSRSIKNVSGRVIIRPGKVDRPRSTLITAEFRNERRAKEVGRGRGLLREPRPGTLTPIQTESSVLLPLPSNLLKAKSTPLTVYFQLVGRYVKPRGYVTDRLAYSRPTTACNNQPATPLKLSPVISRRCLRLVSNGLGERPRYTDIERSMAFPFCASLGTT